MRRAAAVLAIAGLLIGTPTMLVFLFGPPTLPQPNLAEFVESLSGQLLSAETVFRLLGRMAWLLWAHIAGLSVLRIIALKIMTPRSKAGPALSTLTGRLTPSFVLRIIDIALGGTLLLAPLVIPISAAAAGPQGALVDTRTEHHSPSQSRSYLVRPGDSLWKIAEQQLGSGDSWPAIFELNKGRQFPDGRTLSEPRLIHPNWLLWLPGAGEAGSEMVESGLSQPSAVAGGEAADPRAESAASPGSAGSMPNEDGERRGTSNSDPAMVKLREGGALAASFVAGIIASQTIAALRRRRRFRPDAAIHEVRPEPSVVIEGRRAGLPERPTLDDALAALISAWPTESSGWPPVLACIEDPDVATFLIDKTESSPSPRSTSSVSFQDDETLKAQVRLNHSPPGESLSALEQGLFIPIGSYSGSESVSYRLLGNPPLSVQGRLTDEFISNLLLACAAGRTIHEVELIVVGTDLQLGPVAEIPHLRQIPWERAPEVLAELQAETLGRARIFAQHGASGLSDFLGAGAPEHLPALVMVTTPPPSRLVESIEGLAASAATSGLGFVGAGWRPALTRLALEVDSQIAVDTDLQIPDRLDSALLSKSDTQKVVDILRDAHLDPQDPMAQAEEPIAEPYSSDSPVSSPLETPDLLVGKDGHDENGGVADFEEVPAPPLPIQAGDDDGNSEPQSQNGRSPNQLVPEPSLSSTEQSDSSAVGSSNERVGPSRIEVRCLGAMSITRDDAALHNGWVKGSKELLAYLIVNRDGVPKDRVLEVIWPDAKLKEGEKLLREALYYLRKQTLGPDDAKWSEDYVRRAGESLILGGDDRWWADVWEFESQASTAGQLGPQQSKAALRHALSLYRGEFCDDCYFSWAEQLRERYRRLYLRSCAKLAEILEADGEVDEAIEVLERGIQVDHLCEDLYRRLIRLEASQGRTNVAIRLFQQLTKVLDRELDLEPEPQTLELMNQVRNISRSGPADSSFESSATH